MLWWVYYIRHQDVVDYLYFRHEIYVENVFRTNLIRHFVPIRLLQIFVNISLLCDWSLPSRDIEVWRVFNACPTRLGWVWWVKMRLIQSAIISSDHTVGSAILSLQIDPQIRCQALLGQVHLWVYQLNCHKFVEN